MTAGMRAAVLWLLLVAFCGRVLGQMLVAFFGVSWLPPMEAWYSGLIPYPILLPAQFVIIVVYAKVCLDFTRGRGYFFAPNRGLGKGLMIFGSVYFAAMVLRYIVRMSLYPDQRWFGGTIPIFFHYVLASFILVVASYHLRETGAGGGE